MVVWFRKSGSQTKDKKRSGTVKKKKRAFAASEIPRHTSDMRQAANSGSKLSNFRPYFRAIHGLRWARKQHDKLPLGVRKLLGIVGDKRRRIRTGVQEIFAVGFDMTEDCGAIDRPTQQQNQFNNDNQRSPLKY